MLITYAPRRVLFFLGLIVAGLVLANLAAVVALHVFRQERVFGLVPLFYLGGERNIPTFVSSLLLLLCAGLLAIIAHIGKRRGESQHWYWVGLAAIFLFLSLDEFIGLHERLSLPIRAALHTSGFLSYAWVIPYGIFVVVLALVYLRFLLRLPASVRHLTVCAGVVYVTGAIGFELLEGHHAEMHGKRNLIFASLVTCEETLELGGALLFLYALMTYIDTQFGNLYFRIASSPEQSLPPHRRDEPWHARRTPRGGMGGRSCRATRKSSRKIC